MTEDSAVQFKFLIPSRLKARVEAAAQSKRRSLSQEIVVALQEKFPEPKAPDTPEIILGAEALVALANTEGKERRKLVLILNDKLAQADSTYRFVLQNGKISIVTVGAEWSPEMALD